MKLTKSWTRLTAFLVLIIGVVLMAAGVIALIIGNANSGYVYSVVTGIVCGVGLGLVIVSGRWLLRYRGKTNAEISTAQKQDYDERWVIAQGQASTITIFVCALFLVICCLVFVIRLQTTAGWFFLIGALLLTGGRNVLTHFLLRDA